MFALTCAVLLCFCALQVSTKSLVKKFQAAETVLEITHHDSVCPETPVLFLEHLIGDCCPEYLPKCFLQIATIWSAERTLDTRRQIYISEMNLGRIMPLFSNENLPDRTVIPIGCPMIKDIDWEVNSLAAKNIKESPLLLKELKNLHGSGVIHVAPILYSLIADNLKELRENFPIQKGLKIMVDRMLLRYLDMFLSLNPRFEGTTTFVGVRARRHLDGVAGAEYYLNAMNNFRARSAVIGTPIFLILTDDPQWATVNLQGNTQDAFVFVIFQAKHFYDVGFLAICNHTIIDSVDDIGVVGSLLGSGTVTCTDTDKAVKEGLKKLSNWEFKTVT